MPPFRKGFPRRLRKAEVDSPCEELFGSINPSRRQQFLGANHAQQFALLGSNQVLPAFPARERQVSGPNMAPPHKVGEQRRPLVVWMGGNHQQAARVGQILNRQLDLRGSR